MKLLLATHSKKQESRKPFLKVGYIASFILYLSGKSLFMYPREWIIYNVHMWSCGQEPYTKVVFTVGLSWCYLAPRPRAHHIISLDCSILICPISEGSTRLSIKDLLALKKIWCCNSLMILCHWIQEFVFVFK